MHRTIFSNIRSIAEIGTCLTIHVIYFCSMNTTTVFRGVDKKIMVLIKYTLIDHHMKSIIKSIIGIIGITVFFMVKNFEKL